ncbi:MAG: ROK family protein [Chloroflexi bacterium]|nr:ROK family protein [Chloroflexota bacterium]
MTLHRSIVRLLINEPMPLAYLQAATSVSLPTLRKAVQELLDSGWIRVVGQSEANGGRPAMLFGLDDRFYLVIGVHFQLPGIRLITSDLAGQVLDESEMFGQVVPSPGDVVNAIAAYVTRIQATYRDRPLLGIGIATPGFTDPDTGDILTIGRVPGWQNFPVCRRLQASTRLPVYAANDVDCMAFAEFQHTNESHEQNLAYVGFDEGVKVSLFFGGKLYKGSLGNPGLIASSLLHVDGVDDRHEVHELLTIVGLNQMFERRMEGLNETERQAYLPVLAASPRQRVPLILMGAVERLPVCREMAQKLIQALSAAVANVIYFVQPDIIVMGGVLSLMPGELFTDLRMAIAAQLPTLMDNHVIIQQARLSSPNSAALGATQHFLQSYLTDAFVVVPQL